MEGNKGYALSRSAFALPCFSHPESRSVEREFCASIMLSSPLSSHHALQEPSSILQPLSFHLSLYNTISKPSYLLLTPRPDIHLTYIQRIVCNGSMALLWSKTQTCLHPSSLGYLTSEILIAHSICLMNLSLVQYPSLL